MEDVIELDPDSEWWKDWTIKVIADLNTRIGEAEKRFGDHIVTDPVITYLRSIRDILQAGLDATADLERIKQ